MATISRSNKVSPAMRKAAFSSQRMTAGTLLALLTRAGDTLFIRDRGD
jgi:hypothetical protein